jgi:hypothetical protein
MEKQESIKNEIDKVREKRTEKKKREENKINLK